MESQSAETTEHSEPAGFEHDRTSIVQIPIRKATRAECRFKTYIKLAYNGNAETPFTKIELNSLHRYLTGRFYFEPILSHTGAAPTHDEIRASIVAQCGIPEWGSRLSSAEQRRDETYPNVPFALTELRHIAALALELSPGAHFHKSEDGSWLPREDEDPRERVRGAINTVQRKYEFTTFYLGGGA